MVHTAARECGEASGASMYQRGSGLLDSAALHQAARGWSTKKKLLYSTTVCYRQCTSQHNTPAHLFSAHARLAVIPCQLDTHSATRHPITSAVVTQSFAQHLFLVRKRTAARTKAAHKQSNRTRKRSRPAFATMGKE